MKRNILVILLFSFFLTGCAATRINLQRDLISVKPEGCVSITRSGTNQIMRIFSDAFPRRFQGQELQNVDRIIPVESKSYRCRIVGNGGVSEFIGAVELWSPNGMEFADFRATTNQIVATPFPADAVELRVSEAIVRRYTPLSVIKKALLTPFAILLDVGSLGLTQWMYAYDELYTEGQYELNMIEKERAQPSSSGDVLKAAPEK
jgi:hypothetical protein